MQSLELNPNPKYCSRLEALLVVSTLFVLLVWLVSWPPAFVWNSKTNLADFHITQGSRSLDFEIYNCDTKDHPIKGTPWKNLAEPYREATLSVLNVFSDTDESRFVWEINGEILTGSLITYTFRSVGKYPIVLTDMDTNEVISAEVICKYVRREIRSLMDADRENLLKALETLYHLDTFNGQKLYGENYRGMDHFLKQHLNGAGMIDCDHWHDGAGIMTHHTAYTLEMEQVLQLINPIISMPYWDYTIDDYLYSDLSESSIWSDEWLGQMAPNNSLKVIDKGRWAFLPLPRAGDYENVNPYGLLRTVWNVNSVPYVTRHNYINGFHFTMGVGCSELYTAFKKDSVAELNEQLNGETHGPVHVQIGGEWDAREEAMAISERLQANIALIAKILWRAGYLRIPDDCDVHSDSDCSTSCPEDLYKKQGKTAYDVMYDLGLFHYITGGIEYDEENDVYHKEDAWDTEEEGEWFELIFNTLCDPGKLGEMYTSAAPADPSFWFLHPASERFLNLRRIVSDIYPLDETWGYVHDSTVASDNGWVCDWSNVKSKSEMPTCEQTFACSGHGADDVLEFTFIGTLAHRTFTNQEFYDFMHPFQEDLPYLYDNYDYDHCVKQDIDFFD